MFARSDHMPIPDSLRSWHRTLVEAMTTSTFLLLHLQVGQFASLQNLKENSVLQTWLQSTTYLQLVGILIGQLGFGFMGDWAGRKASFWSIIAFGLMLPFCALDRRSFVNKALVLYCSAHPQASKEWLLPCQLCWICIQTLQVAMLTDMTVVLLGIILLTVSNGKSEQVVSIPPWAIWNFPAISAAFVWRSL